MPQSTTRSISLPITLASIAVALGIALVVGWVLVLIQNRSMAREVASNTLALVAGVVSLLTIITVLVMFSVFLVQQILEVRRQDSFIDSVTHELKSPLASLKLCLETLPRKELTETQREELRQMMLDDVERLAVFIDDVLETSRVPAWNRSYSLDEVALAPLLQRCVEAVLHRHRLSAESIKVEVPGSLTLRTSAIALETIVKNLLDNAVKYSSEPREIWVRASLQDNRYIEISVKDNGIGLEPKHAKIIFERFYRVQSEEVRKRRGTGLGLFVGASLAKSLGGRLSAQSQGIGKGTTMKLLLPVNVG